MYLFTDGLESAGGTCVYAWGKAILALALALLFLLDNIVTQCRDDFAIQRTVVIAC
jgi:hypothetical protein